MEAIHNLDQYMSDLRQILAQGKKRIGILLGAGAAASINVSEAVEEHKPLIPVIAGLTKQVRESLNEGQKTVVQSIANALGNNPDIETILSKVRSISAALKGSAHTIGEYDGARYDALAREICKNIGKIVSCSLPTLETPYNRLAGWIGGTDREHAIEIFTSNYDLLMEEALEAAKIPYFAGFTGSFQPFFDASTIANNDSLPSNWARLWKLHGSLGWATNGIGELICGKGREANELIYPDHLKYDQIQKLPYTALFDRLRTFLMTSDTLLLTCGFSFNDSHISAVINEALSANPSASVFAFLHGKLNIEKAARALAVKRPNFSAYASDHAVINCIQGKWELGKNNDNKDWRIIRDSFWEKRGQEEHAFSLGDFVAFANFFALSKSEQTYSPITQAHTAA